MQACLGLPAKKEVAHLVTPGHQVIPPEHNVLGLLEACLEPGMHDLEVQHLIPLVQVVLVPAVCD